MKCYFGLELKSGKQFLTESIYYFVVGLFVKGGVGFLKSNCLVLWRIIQLLKKINTIKVRKHLKKIEKYGIGRGDTV